MLTRKNTLPALAFLLLGTMWNLVVVAAPKPPSQPALDINGNISTARQLVLSSPDLTHANYGYFDSAKLLTNEIMKLDADLSGGVKGTINGEGGHILLEVFSIDNAHNKTLVYKVNLTESSTTDYSTGTLELLTRTKNHYNGRHIVNTWTFDNIANYDIKSLLQFVTPYHLERQPGARTKRGFWHDLWRAAKYLALRLGGYRYAPGYNDDPDAPPRRPVWWGYAQAHPINSVSSKKRPLKFDEIPSGAYEIFPEAQPVIVQLTINKASFRGAKIPGIGEILPADFFLNVKVLVNGKSKFDHSYPQNALGGYADTEQVNIDLDDLMGEGEPLTMGDDLTFEITPPFFGFPEPYIRGVPDVWIARFAGDLMYYSTPSVVPGGHRPFLGYDSRVHTLMLRSYPQGFEKTYPAIKYYPNSRKTTWSWTLQRRMNKTKVTYTNFHEWPKTQPLSAGNEITLLNGTKSSQQRRNQKEGLNMQYLTYWPDWQSSDFQEYTGAKYMMGFDDDELAMLNTKYPNPADDPDHSSDNIHVLKLERLPWKETPEGPYTYANTGYPESGFVLNEMVTAYLKANRSNHYFDSPRYNGYEIQDNGTSAKQPNGNGQGNNTAPGRIHVRILKKVFDLSLNVKAPLAEDNGFYAHIEGTKWPSYGERDVPYTLTGLGGLNNDVLDGFSLEYQYEDKIGKLVRKTYKLKELSNTIKSSVRTSGSWTVPFDIHLPAYASVTAYYQRTAQSPRVIIAGKELKPIFLLFTGVQAKKGDSSYLDLKEGRGTGSKIWLEDFRNKVYDDYKVPRTFGDSTRYTSRYSKEYVFNVNDKTTFVTFDGDPHTFDSSDHEWYLGSRYMANRVTDAYLDGSYANNDGNANTEHAYLKFYLKDLEREGATSTLQSAGRSGKEFTKTWSRAGLYEMKVSYRGASKLYYKIKVVNYGTDPGSNGDSILGEIILRKLKSWEKLILEHHYGASLNGDITVAEVVNIYSRYAYVDGPRATTPKENRWGVQRDFYSNFLWFGVNDVGISNNHPAVNSFLTAYNYKVWFWNDWAHHYSSNWLRPGINQGGTIVQGLPPGLQDADVTRIRNEKTELNRFNDYIRDNLFHTTQPAEWQYTIPLISVTKMQGMRMRTNPSCLYDLYKVFDPAHGAFSGNPNLPPTAESIQAPNPPDVHKNEQELYYKLRNKQMILFDPGNIPNHLKVTNKSPDDETSTFIARFSN